MNGTDVFLMRHSYDDHSYIDGQNNPSLTDRGIEMARDASKKYAELLAERGESVDLTVSSRRRATETAEILCDSLDSLGIDYRVFVEPRFRELYQGNMVGLANKSHEERVRILSLGWEIFDSERVKGNDAYRFGTPDHSSERFDELNGFIAPPYGESQNDFSQRIASGFLGVLERQQEEARLPFLIVHRGTVREVLNITHAHASGVVQPSQQSDLEMAGWRYCELFEARIADLNFSLKALREILGAK